MTNFPDVHSDILRHAIELARLTHEYRWSVRPPPEVMAEFDDPFLALRCWSEIEKKHHAGALAIAAATAGSTNSSSDSKSSKRLSLRRHRESSIDHALSSIQAERETAELISAGAMEVHSRLHAACPLFVDELCRLAQIGESPQRDAIAAMAPFVLLHESVAQHPRMRCLSIADGSMVLEIGISVVRTHILTNTYCAAYGMTEGERRCSEVRRYAGTWLIDNCKDAARAIVPVYWGYNARTNEKLSASEESELVNSLMSNVPFLMIGLTEILRLDDAKHKMVRSLYRRIV